jgi:UDP-N-acetylmuramoyl-tripeptide--D-alanyl-D-alanine ligase
VINDAYNANPTSMRAALLDLDERAVGRRRVAILGEMAELGDEAPRFHREVDTSGIDLVVGVGELARAYEPDEWVATAAEAGRLAHKLVGAGDVVLVKGSRSVGLEVVADALAGATAP